MGKSTFFFWLQKAQLMSPLNSKRKQLNSGVSETVLSQFEIHIIPSALFLSNHFIYNIYIYIIILRIYIFI